MSDKCLVLNLMLRIKETLILRKDDHEYILTEL
jgi:hypothetical protein